MKKIYFIACNVLLMFFVSCSSSMNEGVSSEESNAEDYAQIIVEAKPYICPAMQEIINRFDTATVAIPLEDVFPQFNKLLISDSLTIINPTSSSTRSTDGTSVSTGYSTTTFLFKNKAVTISKDNSTLRESLGYSFNSSSNKEDVYYLSATAITYYCYFSDAISYFFPAFVNGDFMGVNPDNMVETIDNNSYFQQGFHSDEKISGKLYYFTTYAIGVSPISGYYGYWVPSNSVNIDDLDIYGRKLQWRYYAL